MKAEIVLKTAEQLELGDNVACGIIDGEAQSYNYGIVSHMCDEYVTIQRPYMHHADFSCSSCRGTNGTSVIVYTGHETYQIYKGTNALQRVIVRSGGQLK